MKIIFSVTLPKNSIMVSDKRFLRDCFGFFDFWTFFLSIFEIPKKVLHKIFKFFTTRGVPFFDLFFRFSLHFSSTTSLNRAFKYIFYLLKDRLRIPIPLVTLAPLPRNYANLLRCL